MSVDKGSIDGIPHRVGAIVADMSTALCGFQAIAVALYARRDEPRGRYLQASLMQGVSVLQTVSMMTSYREGGTIRPGLARRVCSGRRRLGRRRRSCARRTGRSCATCSGGPR